VVKKHGDRRGTASAPTHCALTSLNPSDPERTFERVRILKQKMGNENKEKVHAEQRI
jgi:hypothetical protein